MTGATVTGAPMFAISAGLGGGPGWAAGGAQRRRLATQGAVRGPDRHLAWHQAGGQIQDPFAVAAGCASVAANRRRLYWIADPEQLHRAVVEDVNLGRGLLAATAGPARVTFARALAESSLLAGRIEFFDLGQPERAAESFTRALQFAGEAEDSRRGAAILGHAAFVPGWAGDRDGASDRLAAARSHARRSEVGGLMWAWLDAVDAECATRAGDTAAALTLIGRAESHLREDPSHAKPDWMDWFSPVRLSAFKGDVELRAGHPRRAERTLTEALERSTVEDTKQRAVILADLAGAHLAQDDIPRTCECLHRALDEITQQWYATALTRVRDVRRALRSFQDDRTVRELDERLYDWPTAASVLRG